MVANLYHLGAAREDPTARLREAGWEPKVRCGKRIWRDPTGGGWYSEEMALEMARRGNPRSEGNGEE